MSEIGKTRATLFAPETYEFRWTTIHILFIAFLGLLWFPKNLYALYSNDDSVFRLVLYKLGREFGEFGSIWDVSPHFGLGSVMSFVDPFLEPTHLVFEVTGSAVAVYIFLAVVLFLAAYMFGRSLGFSGFTSRLAGWILTLAFIPFSPRLIADWSATMSPFITFLLAVQTIAIAIFIRIGRQGRCLDIIGILLFTTLMAYIVVTDLHYLMVYAPYSALVIFAVTAVSRSCGEAVCKAAALMGVGAVVVFLDVGTVLANFTAYDARLTYLIGHDISIPRRSYLTSLINNTYYPPRFVLLGAPVLGWLGVAGLIFTFVHALMTRARRRAAVCFVAFGCMAGLYAMSREYMIPDVVWPWASPSYFEFALYPAYAVTGAFLLVKLFGLYIGLAGKAMWSRSGLRREIFGDDGGDGGAAEDGGVRMRRTRRHEAMLFLTLFAAATVGGMLPNPINAVADAAAAIKAPPPTWPAPDRVIATLADKIPVRLDAPFRGSFEDLTGKRDKFRTVLTWQAGIATLSEYHRSLSFFSRAYLVELQWARSNGTFPIMRRLPLDRRVALLRALGVAYVTLPEPAAHPGLAPVAGWPGTEKSHLYRLRSPNLGHYSPTQAIKVRDWAAFTGMLASKPIDWERSFVVLGAAGAWADGPLVKADAVGPMVIVKNGVAITAATRGRSLVVLPRQFSNCYRWEDAPGHSGTVKIVRVNLYQIGLLFEGRIEGGLKFHYKWGGDLRCRARDVAEAYDIGVVREGYVRPGHMGFFAKILMASQRRALGRTLEWGRRKQP